jgi:hypothetical protein
MRSPFPGMDPYLERYWGDIHTSLIVYARNQLNAQLPDDLQARVEESAGVEIEDRRARTVDPDVRVVEEPDASWAVRETAAVAVAEPYVVWLEDEPRTHRHLEIVDTTDGGRVVTAIEVLSPANNAGLDGPVAYRRKQRQYLEAQVNLVEIELVRGASACWRSRKTAFLSLAVHPTEFVCAGPRRPSERKFTPSHSACRCRTSAFRSARPTRTWCCVYNRSSMTATGMADISGSIIASSPCRVSAKRTRPGSINCCAKKVCAEHRLPRRGRNGGGAMGTLPFTGCLSATPVDYAWRAWFKRPPCLESAGNRRSSNGQCMLCSLCFLLFHFSGGRDQE